MICTQKMITALCFLIISHHPICSVCEQKHYCNTVKQRLHVGSVPELKSAGVQTRC